MKDLLTGFAIILYGLLVHPGAEDRKQAPDYFPLRKGSVWTYEGVVKGQSREIQKTVAAVEKVGERECHVVEDAGFPGLFRKLHLQKTADGIRLVKVSHDLKEPATWIQLPLKKGSSWEARLITTDGSDGGTMKFSVEDEEEVKVPAGTYRAFRIKLVGETDGPTLEVLFWLAKDVGEVKRELKLTQDGNVISETRMQLKAYEPGKG